MESFGEKLKRLRESRELSQEELAKELFVTRSAVAKWEQDRGFPSIDSLQRISKFFKVSIDDLVSDKELKILEVKTNKKLRVRTKLLIVLSVFLAIIMIAGIVLASMYCPRKLSAYLKIQPEEVTEIYVYRPELDEDGYDTGKNYKVYVSDGQLKNFLGDLKNLKVTPRYDEIKGKGAYPLFIETEKSEWVVYEWVVYQYELNSVEKRVKYYIEQEDYQGLLKKYNLLQSP